MAIRKAQRRKAKLRLGLSGPAGSGKTFGALLVAYGITDSWDDICLIDSENNSGDLYANYNKNGIQIGEYNVISLSPPYTPEKYTAAIKECEDAGIKVIVIDSLTHAWAGEGGLLDKKGQIEKSNKPGVNSWTAWRDITPMHNRLVESILSSKCHIIATLRAKMEHVQEKDPSSGKVVIRKIGMNPIQRDGMEYEFTTFIDVDQDHQCTSSKDRTSIVDGKVFQLSTDLGRQLLEWLESGVDAPAPAPTQRPAPTPGPAPAPPTAPPPAPSSPTPPQPGQGTATDELSANSIKALHAIRNQMGKTEDEFKIGLGAMLKREITSLKQITEPEAKAIIKALNNKLKGAGVNAEQSDPDRTPDERS